LNLSKKILNKKKTRLRRGSEKETLAEGTTINTSYTLISQHSAISTDDSPRIHKAAAIMEDTMFLFENWIWNRSGTKEIRNKTKVAAAQ
jgi:hypothetical protein